MSVNPKYYAAYDERYKTAHAHGVSWSSMESTPIVMETLKKYNITPKSSLLEVGCGEGRDAHTVLDAGYPLLASDLSLEAIAWCRSRWQQYASHFQVLDCLKDTLPVRFDFIYAVAVLHMLVVDADRSAFYRFLRSHLKPNGIALICTMGDGAFEMQSDISQAFTLQERNHESGKMLVAGTSCRMVSFPTFQRELRENGFAIAEQGITESLPDFNSLMYAVVRSDG